MKNLLSRFLCLSILLLNDSLVWAQTTATVLVKIGVKKAGLEPSAYLTDFATAAEQMAAEVVGDILPSEYQTRVSTHSTGTLHTETFTAAKSLFLPVQFSPSLPRRRISRILPWKMLGRRNQIDISSGESGKYSKG